MFKGYQESVALGYRWWTIRIWRPLSDEWEWTVKLGPLSLATMVYRDRRHWFLSVLTYPVVDTLLTSDGDDTARSAKTGGINRGGSDP